MLNDEESLNQICQAIHEDLIYIENLITILYFSIQKESFLKYFPTDQSNHVVTLCECIENQQTVKNKLIEPFRTWNQEMKIFFRDIRKNKQRIGRN